MGKALRVVAMVGIAVGAAVLAAPTGGLSVAAALGVTGTTAAVVGAVAAVAFSLAATTLLNAIAPPPGAKSGAQGALQNYRQSIASSTIVYGLRRVGGLIVFFHPRKVGKQHFRYFVIAAAGHRSKGVVSWHLGDEQVTVDETTGAVTSGSYAGAAWLWFARGASDQAAHPVFVAECGGKWTADHRGRGVTAIYAKFEMTDAVIEAGMPAITATIEGKDDIVDVRDGSAGFTRNAQLVWRDWLALPREEGGFGAAADELDDDWDAVCANVCDEVVATPDGSEARYSFDSVIATGASPSQVRQTFVDSCAGTYTAAGGVFLLRPGYWEPASVTLSEDDLAGPIGVRPLLDPQEVLTEVAGTYVDPASGYQPQPIPSRIIAAADIRQGDADLAHVTSVWQAQRVTEIILRRAQCEKTVTWPMNIVGIGVTALDTVTIKSQRYGLSNYAWTVKSWAMGQDFGVALGLREENPEIYDDPAYIVPAAGGTIDRADAITDPGTAALQDTVDVQAGVIAGQIEALEALRERVDNYQGSGPIP